MLAHKLSPNFEDRFAKIDISITKLGDPPVLVKSQSSHSIVSDASSSDHIVSNHSENSPFSSNPHPKSKSYNRVQPKGTRKNSDCLHTTAPSSQPFLSTAKRAESRHLPTNLRHHSTSGASELSSSHNSITNASSSTPKTPSRHHYATLYTSKPNDNTHAINTNSLTPSTNPSSSSSYQALNHKASSKSLPSKKQTHKRYLSCPPSERSSTSHSEKVPHTNTSAVSNHQFSFMRETSSSSLKKTIKPSTPNPTFILHSKNPSNRPAPRSRSVSEINQNKINSSTYKKRQLSNNKTIQNHATGFRNVSNKMTASNPSNSSTSSNSSASKTLELPSYTSNFTHVAEESKRTQSQILLQSHCDMDISPKGQINNPPTRTKKEYHPYSVLSGKPNLKPNTKPESNPNSDKLKIGSRQSSAQLNPITKVYESSGKVPSLEELCTLIYEQEPHLFEDKDESDEYRFTANHPLTSQDVISKAESVSNNTGEASLSIYERGEILRKRDLYFIPNRSIFQEHGTSRSINIRSYSDNYGFDDENGNYVVIPHDHINYRYEIHKVLGNGSFGNVVLCKDHKYSNFNKTNKIVAIKIIKNDLNWSLQAVYEIKMLKHLNENFKVGGPGINISNFDSEYLREYGNDSNECPVLTYYDHFHFRGHMCIITEVLSLNLYSLLELIKFKGISVDLLKVFSTKILCGLQFIHNNKIIHCDIKPENIMIKLPYNFHPENDFNNTDDFDIKIIDFGSSCFNDEISYSYIQSRFYRAPEVILGAKYNNMIDIWSFGCVIAELYSGLPIFPGKNELEQIGLISEIFGPPQSSLIVSQRNKLIQSIRSANAAKNLFDASNLILNNLGAAPPNKAGTIDEKSIKRTLLYTLFDMEGKFNLQSLNHRLQAAAQVQNAHNTHQPQTSFKKNIKPNSKSLEVLLKINNSSNISPQEKQNNQSLVKFLHLIFKWDPNERLDATQLLDHRFLKS